MTKRAMTGRAKGFTLLEMLVALSILSLAALALVRLDAFTARSSAALADKTLAQITADNHAITLLTDPSPPTIGSHSSSVTNGGKAWRIVTRIAPTADPSLLRIDIRVIGSDGRSAGLTTIRPAS